MTGWNFGVRAIGVRGRLLPLRGLALVVGLCAFAGTAGAEECPPGNLVPGASISGAGIRGHARTLADEFLPAEGTRWDASSTVVLESPSAFIRIDLGSVLSVNALMVQADADDSYVVQGSLDGVRFSPVWVAPPAHGSGLRFRSAQFERVRARYLRVSALGGDGRYAVSELMAMCAAPGQPLLHAAAGTAKRTRTLTHRRLVAVKLAIGLLAVGLFLSGLIARRRGGSGANTGWRDGALAMLGAAAALLWWNLGAFHFDHHLHREDSFHHFVGSKYFAELGYEGLYACAAVADADAGFEEWVRRRPFRDLRSNDIISGAALLERAGDCRKRFSPGRWREFELDLAWFRARTPPQAWALMLQDHGYNATPAWGMTARLLSRNLAASEAGVLALTLLDPLLLLAMGGILVRVFGWRAAAVAAIWWGTNLPAEFAWTGGSFLRQDWLLVTVAGVALARRGMWASAGGMLAWATLLRVYPGLLAAGLGLKALASMWQRRSLRVEESHRRFGVGFLATALILLAVSSAADPRGVGAWGEFLENTRVDLGKSGTNHVGLGVVVSYDPERLLRTIAESGRGNPVNLWQEEKIRVLSARRWMQVAALLAFSWLLLRRTREAEDWEALVLGVGFIPLAVSFPSYYASLFLLYGLLWEKRREAVALPLAVLAAWTQCAMLIWGPEGVEEIFFGVSVGVVIAVVVMTAAPGSVPDGETAPPA